MYGSITLAVFFHFFGTCFCYFNDGIALYWRRSGGEPCEPFTVFMVYCNKCVCSSKGIEVCTNEPCTKTNLPFFGIDKTALGINPGEYYFKDIPVGIEERVLGMIPQVEKHIQAEGGTCVPFSVFKVQCNKCVCSSRGIEICTHESCTNIIGASSMTTCEPFSTFMMGCNNCICTVEGLPYCTKNDCVEGQENLYDLPDGVQETALGIVSQIEQGIQDFT